MIETIAFLLPPFLVAVCLVGIHAWFGIQVLARKVIFVDLALAQIAALGATAAFMLGHRAQSAATYGYSLAFTLLAAVLLAFTRAWGTRVPQEALIGVIYVVAAAAAILLIDQAPQGAEHLKQVLTGNILTSGWNDLALIVPLYLAIGLLHWLWRGMLAVRLVLVLRQLLSCYVVIGHHVPAVTIRYGHVMNLLFLCDTPEHARWCIGIDVPQSIHDAEHIAVQCQIVTYAGQASWIYSQFRLRLVIHNYINRQ